MNLHSRPRVTNFLFQIFDRPLCVRQLRYSGLMETAKIRRSGYPIRHSFKDFVQTYRFLVPGIPPAFQTDCRVASQKICQTLFNEDQDYRVGKTKVFLRTAEDAFLEEELRKVFQKSLSILQRNIKRWYYRRRFVKLREAALVFQKHFRARGYRNRFLTIRCGYLRLQATIRQRYLTNSFQKVRSRIIPLQVICKGYLFRNIYKKPLELRRSKMLELQKIKNGKEEGRVEAILEELTKLDDFLDVENKRKYDTPKDEYRTGENKIITTPKAEEEFEDLSEYNFRKFAATYFLGNINHHYSKRALKSSLLDLPTGADVVAAQALWVTILRFMGDLPEPRYVEDDKPVTESVMTKLTQTLSRNFAKSKQFEQLRKKGEKGKKLVNLTLKTKNKWSKDLQRGILEDEFAKESYKSWLHEKRTTNLEKLHFVIGHGILRPELR